LNEKKKKKRLFDKNLFIIINYYKFNLKYYLKYFFFIVKKFVREFQPKYSHLVDNYANKYRGKVDFDASFLMYPRVKGINGKKKKLN